MKPLTRCPQCKYSLKGLPADYNCPECGFEYDAETAAWESHLDKKEISAIVFVSCFVIWTFLNRVLSGTFPPRSIFGILTVLFGALLLFVTYRAFENLRAGYAICTTRQGIWIKRGRRTALHSWGNVEFVFWNASHKVSGVKIKGRDRPLYISKVLRKQQDFKNFEFEVHRRKQAEEGKPCSGS